MIWSKTSDVPGRIFALQLLRRYIRHLPFQSMKFNLDFVSSGTWSPLLLNV